MRRAGILLALALTSGACASARSTERSYVRANLDAVNLRSIDLVVVTKGPPRAAGESLDVKGFEPPAAEAPLLSGPEDQATRVQLARALAAKLRADGYQVNVITADAPEGQLPLHERPRTETSTGAAGTASISVGLAGAATASAAAPSAPRFEGGRKLEAKTALKDVLDQSTADAVLVVRAVPIDAFFIDIGAGTRLETTPTGQERVRDYRPTPREGRLLAGQAFLFDRASGLRLWTRQLPDYPDNGRLVPEHKFLRYGVVYPPGTPAPAPDERAKPAAENFTQVMLADFPRAHAGTEQGRAVLSAIDVGEEQSREAFFDRGHLGLELGAAWAIEHATLDATLGMDPLPSLGTGAVAPAGIVKAVPRLSYIAPGGLVLGVAVPFGYAPSGFSRSYERDNPNPNLMDPNDRAATVGISHSTTFGVEATAGVARFLTHTIILVPNGGLFGEVLSADATPATVIDSPTRTRVGVLGGADLWLRASDASPLYGRFGADLKLGLDLGGPLTYGFELVAALGLFL